LCLAHFLRFDVGQPIQWDARYYLYEAGRVAQGAVPYRDFFEMKTPLSFAVGGLVHHLARRLAADPLLAVRVASLLLAALAGVLLGAVHRSLARGRVVPWVLAILAYCGFALLGWLPSLGVMPKLLMAVCASAAALAVADGWWFAAGAAGGLAFLDWQVGVLVLLGGLVAAALARERRGRATLEVLAGAAAVLGPFALLLLAWGALGPMFDQTIAALFPGGAGSVERTVPERVVRILATVRVGCQGHRWLFWLGVAGMLAYPLWLWRWRRSSRLAPAAVLAVVHYGLVAFSLLDYQGYGDLYVLLHSAAFFAAVVLVEAWRRLAACARGHPGLVSWAVVAASAIATRPVSAHATFAIPSPTVRPRATLDEQREVARAVSELTRSRRLAVVGPAELLYLSEAANGVPYVYWNVVPHRVYRQVPWESSATTFYRTLAAHGVEALVLDRTTRREGGDRRIASRNGAYHVVLRPLRAADAYQRALIASALAETGGSQRRAAALLGWTRARLHREAKRLGLLKRLRDRPGLETPPEDADVDAESWIP
jgi:hypothetical protein